MADTITADLQKLIDNVNKLREAAKKAGEEAKKEQSEKQGGA